MRPFSRAVSAVVVSLALAAVALAGDPVTKPLRVFDDDLSRPLALSEPAAIRSASGSLPATRAPVASGTIRRFGNAALNGRSPFALPAGTFRARLAKPHGLPRVPSLVLAAEDREVVAATEAWTLLDSNGRTLATLGMGSGELAIDLARKVVFAPEPLTGRVSAIALQSGARAFAIMPYFPTGYSHDAIATTDSDALLLSTQELQMQEQMIQPEVTIFDLRSIAAGASGPSVSPKRRIFVATRPIVSAIGDARVVFHVPGHLVALDRATLEPKLHLAYERTLHSLGVDEAGRIFAIASEGERVTIEALSPAGERLWERELPAAFAKEPLPPLLGYDRTTYAVAGTEVFALDPAGAVRWRRTLAYRAAGAIVTSNDKLLVAAGHEVFAFDAATSAQEKLYACPGEMLTCAPALSPSGEVFCVTERNLVGLSTK